MTMPPLTPDITIGRIIQTPMQGEVTVRGDQIILSFSNQTTRRGMNVSFSVKVAQDLIELLMRATDLAQGRVN